MGLPVPHASSFLSKLSCFPPPAKAQCTKLPLSTAIPSLDSSHESCLFLFIRWDILFPEKGVRDKVSHRQGDLGEVGPRIREFPAWAGRREGGCTV